MFLGQAGLHGLVTPTAKPTQNYTDGMPDDMDTITTFCDMDQSKVNGWLRGANRALLSTKRDINNSIVRTLAEMDANTDVNEKLGMIAMINLLEYALNLPVSTINGERTFLERTI